ncbi:MAG: HNH endonuclease signature motif containing protein [Nitrospira sp.]
MELDGHTVAVHRVLYTHFHGYIPNKKQVDHTCENRSCLNPDHLELVTHKQNQRRKSGRRPKASAGLASSILGQIDLEELIQHKRENTNVQERDVAGSAQTGRGDGGTPAGAGEADPVS